jgi:hypothetical protein
MALFVTIFSFENVDGHTVPANAESYKVMLEAHLHNELHSFQQDLLWFQQDGATAHKAQTSMQVLRTLFPGTFISHFRDTTWLAHLFA